MRRPVKHSIWLVLVLSFLNSSVCAGTLGDLTYEIANGQVTITDCDTAAEGALVIPAEIEGLPVTSIGGATFFSCSILTSITIPDGVTSIGDGAFIRCDSLTSIAVALGNSAYTSLGGILFSKDGKELLNYPAAKSGRDYTIPEGVASIGDGAFFACRSLTSITIGEGVTSIGSGAFQDCSSLTSIIIPQGVTSIGNSAFYRCSSLTSITIPDTVTSIGTGAFFMCISLTSVIIPDGVTSIGTGAFTACSSLASIIISNSVTSIGNGAFTACSSLTSVTIPENVTTIGDGAFSNCYALESIAVPAAFYSRTEANRIGDTLTRELWGINYRTHSNNTQPTTTPTLQPSIRMAPVIMVQGEEGSVKTIEVADSPDGPWQFWMDVTATASGVAITDLDGQAHKRFYRVRD